MTVKEILKQTPIYTLYKGFMKTNLYKKYIKIKTAQKPFLNNVFATKYILNCLLIYITDPFVHGISNLHQNSWQCIEIAKAISKRGYNIDVAYYDNPNVKLQKKYDFIIGLIPRHIDIYSNFQNKNCIKVAYLTSSNLRFTSEEERKRIEDLEIRRGIKLLPRRQTQTIEKSIETFNACFFIGNEYNFKTYAEFKMPPVYYIKNNGYKLPFETDFSKKDAKKFLFLGSVGQVHKGLDLLLEIFERKPELELFICASISQEEDFENAFYKELYETPNIHTFGFVNVFSDKFKEISDQCAYLIFPSCAEGQAGSVSTAMSAGCIPIISKMCGFSEKEGILLDNCTIECIEKNIDEYSAKDNKWVVNNCKARVKIIEEDYSEQSFLKSINDALDGVLNAVKDNR